MTQESGGADPHINPPSFIPAGNRRTFILLFFRQTVLLTNVML